MESINWKRSKCMEAKSFSDITNSQTTVVSTFASLHKLPLKPKASKRASASPARVTAFQDGFRIAHAQKNKINLCFVDTVVQIDKKYES